MASAELYDPSSRTWTTGFLHEARYHHTATLLENGQVLVAGGYNSTVLVKGGYNGTNRYLASAELYDPWTTTGSLHEARYGHTATLLRTGQVLVTGGYNSGGIHNLTSAELYDPSSETWTTTGSLHEARYGHTATLLRTGQVLVAGGYNNTSHPLASAELYDPSNDPSNGTWTTTGSLHEARYGHTATLLQSGQVLVAGGLNDSGGIHPLASAELYDPSNGTWTTAEPLPEARIANTATLLQSGQVLVAGGYNSTSHYLATAEIYDPLWGTWTTGSLHEARRAHTATLLPTGQVLVAGGLNDSGFLTSAELYDPLWGTWTTTGSLHEARYAHTATLLPTGQVLVAGGYNSSSGFPILLTSAELYDPSSGRWTMTGSMQEARDFHTATLLRTGQVLVAGGSGYVSTGFWGSLATAELYFLGTTAPT